MELHHYFMELRGTPWNSMAFLGTPWNSMDFHEFHGGISREVAVTPATDPVTVVVG